MPGRKRNWDKSPDGVAYRHQYTREHYDRIGVTVRKGMKEQIDEAARAEGISTSAYIVKAIEAYMNDKGTE